MTVHICLKVPDFRQIASVLLEALCIFWYTANSGVGLLAPLENKNMVGVDFMIGEISAAGQTSSKTGKSHVLYRNKI
jgi:hypothetical protein